MMKPKAKALWTNALRSGKYAQICSLMRDIQNTDEDRPDMGTKNMCVMGVLAELALQYSGLQYTEANWLKFAKSNEFPSERTLKWAGLTVTEATTLVDQNDDEEMSFKEFANHIEKNL